ncbi:MAG TPA: hypothetical protein VNW04_11815 [Puia sp.]|nr:hypothetical protein [Puia sp.]
MIINTDKSPRYLRRVLALPLLLLLFPAFATRKEAPRDPVPLLRFFNKHLRYPQAALEANLEGKIWFFIKVDENGKLADIHDLPPSAGKDHKIFAIKVTSRPAANPSEGTGPAPKEAIFLEEATKASHKMGEDNNPPIPAGEYYISIDFKIERP